MKNTLILHGTGNNHTGNWFPWLQKELEKKGYKVWTPDLPNSNKPNINKYNQYIFSQWKFDKDSIIVGHSSGAVAILGILANLQSKIVINKAILVAGFTDNLGMKEFDGLFLSAFDWGKIKNKARKFVIFHSDNDPYIPLSYGKKLSDFLNAKLILMREQGHFNLEKGPEYKKFPVLLKQILE